MRYGQKGIHKPGMPDSSVIILCPKRPQEKVSDEIRPYHNFAPFVRQIDERKAQTCAMAILPQLTNQGKANKIVRTFQVRCLRRETDSRLERGGNMFNPRERSWPITFFAFLSFACLLLSGIANAAPSITLSKKSGPPTSRILVSGRGFESNVGVDIYFGTKDEALIVTNGRGEFDNAQIHAPRSARPGEHWITALERNNDKGAQKPFLIQTDWSEFHFDADGTRVNSYENVLNPKTVGGLDLKWSYLTDNYVNSSPAIVNGVVYVGGDKMHALNASTGAQLWTALRYVSSSPAVANGVVYVGSDDNTVYALNARTGALLWSYATGLYVQSSPAVANGVVYVGSFDGNVYALNASTGAKLWSYLTGGSVFSSPAVVNGVVYVGSDYNVYALSASTGAKLWSYTTGSYVGPSPAVANGVVYIGSLDHKLYALNADTGVPLWSYATGNAVESSPAVANGVVYVGSDDNNVYALNARTGALLWSYLTGGNVYSSPAVVNGTMYIGSDDGRMYAFALTHGGAMRATAKPGPASKRPDPKTLRPDFNLKVSQPVASLSGL